MEPRRDLIVIMGPSGCGKSTVGKLLASALRIPFVEGDDHHPPANVQRMAAGLPLQDSDRAAWIDGIVAECGSRPEGSLVLSCSALTPYVQSRLRGESGRHVRFVLLELPRAELVLRLARRTRHFMPPELADSQLAALEAPRDAITIDAAQDPQTIVELVSGALGQNGQQHDDRKARKADDSRR